MVQLQQWTFRTSRRRTNVFDTACEKFSDACKTLRALSNLQNQLVTNIWPLSKEWAKKEQVPLLASCTTKPTSWMARGAPIEVQKPFIGQNLINIAGIGSLASLAPQVTSMQQEWLLYDSEYDRQLQCRFSWLGASLSSAIFTIHEIEEGFGSLNTPMQQMADKPQLKPWSWFCLLLCQILASSVEICSS